jgi:hypothetical protein
MSIVECPDTVEIIPPRENSRDVLAVEMFLSSLLQEQSFSLEIAGDENGCHFVIRGQPETLSHIQEQLRTVYPHVDFRPLKPVQDYARSYGRATYHAQLFLRQPVYFPLRMFRDKEFSSGDPLRGLIAAMRGLKKKERVLAQLILSPAPRHWGRAYENLARRDQAYPAREHSTSDITYQLGLLGTVVLMVLPLIYAFLMYLQKNLLMAGLATLIVTLEIAACASIAYLFRHRLSVDSELVRQKISKPAFDVSLRLVADADTWDRAEELLKKAFGAYQQFALADGNSFRVRVRPFNQFFLWTDERSWLEKTTGMITRLNVNELAAMWHLPIGEDVQLVHHTMAKRFLPTRRTEFAQGILIGHAESQGERMPIHLAPGMLERNTFMIAKTQKGKSTLMAHLAAAAMQEERALVVIDPHGDLAQVVSGRVPRHRLSTVRYLDWGDKQRAVGFNFLDVQQGCDEDVIISNIVHAGTEIWTENWGPRMEDALRYALHTLLVANVKLAAQGQEQFTLLDVNALFRLPAFRRRLIKEYVRNEETIDWWQHHYDRLPQSLRMDVISPVVTKLDRLAENAALKNITGQSRSTLNFRDVLSERGIVLINTASGLIGDDVAGLLTALFIDSLNYAIRAQTSISDSRQRPRVMVIIDELQKLAGVNYGSFLAELRKMGASFVMGTQSLAQLEPTARNAESAVLSNIDTLFVFDTHAADARMLSYELDEVVDSTDIINLPDHTAYLKTQVGSERTPTIFVKILPPTAPDPMAQQQINAQAVRYTVPIVEAERRREIFVGQWYGRDRRMQDKDSTDGGDASSDDYGGANQVGYDPKSPIRPKGPARPSMPIQSVDETKSKSQAASVKAPVGSKQSQEWGKP